MFTAVETEYLRCLVMTMSKEYPYYLAYTVTDETGNNTADAYIYFSKTKITGNGLYSYSVPSGSLRYRLDSNGYSSTTNTAARVQVTTASGAVTVHSYEFVYTNASFAGTSIQPDIKKLNGGETVESVQGLGIIVTLLLLVLIIWRIFGR